MGQAQVDLPASDVPPDPAAPAADDLLAQLAGEDIDRLLAEADVDTASASPAAAPLAPADSHTPPTTSEKTLSADEQMSDGVDELVKEITKGEESDPPAAPAASPSPSPAAPKPAAPANEPGNTQVVASSAGTSAEPSNAGAAAQQAAPSGPPPESAASTTPAGPQVPTSSETGTSGEKETSQAEPASAGAVAGAGDGPSPFYVRILEFVNSPLDAFPDPVRDIIGKIALVTLINSIAVIGYVLLFRKK